MHTDTIKFKEYTLMNIDEIANIAQTISFAFEDNYTIKAKKEAFIALFDKYLAAIEALPRHMMQ